MESGWIFSAIADFQLRKLTIVVSYSDVPEERFNSCSHVEKDSDDDVDDDDGDGVRVSQM